MTTEIDAVWPGKAKRSAFYRRLLYRQDNDVNYMLKRDLNEATRRATLEEQVLCMELTTEPVTAVRVWLEEGTTKLGGRWVKCETFRWHAY